MKKTSYITQLGSNWNNGSKAGLYWNVNNSVGNRNRNISSHLINAIDSAGDFVCPRLFHILWMLF